jgi:hypothetical protein
MQVLLTDPPRRATKSRRGSARDDAASNEALARDMDDWHQRSCEAQRHLLACVAEADRRRVWESSGARDMAHWLRMRYGISDWKARRWIDAAHALESLPRTSEAFASGRLGVDKVVELTRFATPDSEKDLLPWAERVAPGAIKAKGEELARRSMEDAERIHRDRSLRFSWEDEGRALFLEGWLPAAQGQVVLHALDRVASTLPVLPGEDRADVDQRRADALVALSSARIADDPDPDRATVVVHVPVEVLTGDDAAASGSRGEDSEQGCALEGGGVVSTDTARRLACSARVQTVVEDERDWIVGVGRASREPPAWMVRALRRRDGGCRFPGCGTRAFTHPHHVRWWSAKGPTDVDNLVLLCTFHHVLVHEAGWSLTYRRDNTVRFYRPDGKRYGAGPAPPGEARRE